MRVIIYIDMNSFFVSCHQIIDPTLKNKPVVVCNASRRAVISSASYEARKYDIKSGMPLYLAKQRCKELIQVNIIRDLYFDYSAKIFHYLARNFTASTENCSIDEYCLDVSKIYKTYGSAMKCAETIQKQLFDVFKLPCSIGISYNKFLAKIASKIKKPNGIYIFSPNSIEKKLWTLDIKELYGIGLKTANKLKTIGINTIGALANSKNNAQLKQIMGKRYHTFVQQARGITISSVKEEMHGRKSVGTDYTLEYDTKKLEVIKTELEELAKSVAQRAKNLLLVGYVVVCGYKVTGLRWTSTQIQLRHYTNSNQIIFDLSWILFKKLWKGEAIRALRISLKKTINEFEAYVPLVLF